MSATIDAVGPEAMKGMRLAETVRSIDRMLWCRRGRSRRRGRVARQGAKSIPGSPVRRRRAVRAVAVLIWRVRAQNSRAITEEQICWRKISRDNVDGSR
jgi:hypothetical protein